jgi:hypothetical protein
MFSITRGTGFQMKLGNGWTVSVQFGPGTYSDHHMGGPRSMVFMGDTTTPAQPHKSALAEVAAIHPNGELVDVLNRGDTVAGWMDADAVVEFIALVAALDASDFTVTAEESKARMWRGRLS